MNSRSVEEEKPMGYGERVVEGGECTECVTNDGVTGYGSELIGQHVWSECIGRLICRVIIG